MKILIENDMVIDGFGPIIQEGGKNFISEANYGDNEIDDDEYEPFPKPELKFDEESSELIEL